jgi:HTH-type transcriptional regulator/antitoxin MqsA
VNLKGIACPVCGVAALQVELYSDEIPYQNGAIRIDGLQSARCENCGADPVVPEQIRANHLLIADAKRASDGLLYGEQIRSLRERLGLSQADAAALFGGGSTGFSKYERGQVVQSVPMDRLLRLVAEHPHLINSLRKIAAGTEWNVVHASVVQTDLKPIEVSTTATLGWPQSMVIADIPHMSEWELLGSACNDDWMAQVKTA